MRWALLKRKVLNAGAIGLSYFKLIPDFFRLGRHSLVIDCGANVGHISKFLSLRGARVIAFEPDPIAFKRLLGRCGHRKNVTCIQKGVWDKNAVISLFTHNEGEDISFTVGSSIIADKINVNPGRGRSIEVIDLVDFIKNQERHVSLIKLDVEGAEIEILKKVITTGAYSLFDRMYVETHETKIPTQAKDLDWIKSEIRDRGIKNIRLNWL